MDTLMQDLRFALRQLRKHPGFTAIVVLMLGLGIGANSALLAIVNAVLLRPLPYPHSERIVSIGSAGGGSAVIDAQSIRVLSHQPLHSMEALAEYEPAGANLTGGDEPERVGGGRVSSQFFRVMSVRPALGRTFSADDSSAGAPLVVLLGHGLWMRDFGGDPAVLDRTVELDGQRYTVVGVMPAGFDFPQHAQYWLPLELPAPEPGSIHYAFLIGRLRPDVSLHAARAELAAVQHARAADLPTLKPNEVLSVVSLHERLYGDLRPALLILLGTVACVLLIVCVNVANLLLARAAVRRRELGVRMALGATRARLMRQLLVESMGLALLGGVLGLGIASNGLALFLAVGPRTLTRVPGIVLDARVVMVTMAVSLLTGLLFGIAPALVSSRTDLHDTLSESGLRIATGARSRPRQLLVTAELALAMVLLIGAGLLAKSFVRFRNIDPGFDSHHVLTASLVLPAARYGDSAAVAGFARDAIARIRVIPGVESAALSDLSPLGGAMLTQTTTWDKSGSVMSQSPMIATGHVGTGYFKTFHIPLRTGREFTDADDARARHVAIINEALARVFFPNRSALGEQLRVGAHTPYTIVGIVADVRMGILDKTAPPAVYFPLAQSRLWGSLDVAIRTRGDPLTVASALRQAVREVDPQQPVSHIATLEQTMNEFLAPQRFNALLLGAFAALALLLATFGLYGLLSYLVTQRTHEIGVRMALGAEQHDVLALVLRQGLMLTVAGVALGLVAAFGLTRLLASLLFREQATDPVIFAVVPLVLVVVSVIAILLPARRAVSVDPVIALRAE